MTVAPRALALTGAGKCTEAGRSRPAAVFRATRMLRTMTLRTILRIISRMTWRRRLLAGSLCHWASAAFATAPDVRDYPERGPRGPIMEKRRLRLASCDEALSVITTSPLGCPTLSARLLNHPAERRPVVPFRDPRNRRPEGTPLARAARCYRLYGGIMVNLRRTGNSLARERAVGNDVMKDRSVIPNLTLISMREPFHDAQKHVSGTCMRAANGPPLPRRQARSVGAAAPSVQRLNRR